MSRENKLLASALEVKTTNKRLTVARIAYGEHIGDWVIKTCRYSSPFTHTAHHRITDSAMTNIVAMVAKIREGDVDPAKVLESIPIELI